MSARIYSTEEPVSKLTSNLPHKAILFQCAIYKVQFVKKDPIRLIIILQCLRTKWQSYWLFAMPWPFMYFPISSGRLLDSHVVLVIRHSVFGIRCPKYSVSFASQWLVIRTGIPLCACPLRLSRICCKTRCFARRKVVLLGIHSASHIRPSVSSPP